MILLVEDDKAVGGVVSSILRHAGYAVLECAGPEAALARAETHAGTIDLLLTDVVMPEMSGSQLAERFLVVRPHVKVLYMSGYTDSSIVHHGVLDAGVAFLQKPVTPSSLTKKLRAVLDGVRPALPVAISAPVSPPPPQVGTLTNRRRILVIDDEPLIQRLAARILRLEYEVVALDDARTAVEQIVAGDMFDLVLCDLDMPRMSGPSFFAEIQRVAPAYAGRIAFLTGGATGEIARDFMRSTTNPTLEKPFETATLRAFVKDALTRIG